MRVAAVISDLMLYSRIEAAASTAGASLVRLDAPSDLAAGKQFDLILVDWSARDSSWTADLRAHREAGLRVILFGPHTDLEAHADAREAGLGPMMARSKLVTDLGDLIDGGRDGVPPDERGR